MSRVKLWDLADEELQWELEPQDEGFGFLFWCSVILVICLACYFPLTSAAHNLFPPDVKQPADCPQIWFECPN